MPPVSTTTSTEVPGRLPVAIAGHPYLLDPAGFERTSVPAIREQADTSTEPGEQSLNPRGLWRRSQESWHHGAGQAFLDGRTDTGAADPHRFRISRGVDPWTPGQLSLLADTIEFRSSTEKNVAVSTVGSRIYVVDGNDLYFTASPANLLPNPTFDSATTGWTGSFATLAVVATPVHGGVGALSMTSTSAGTVNISTPTGLSGVAVTPSTGYRLSAFFQQATVGRQIQLELLWYSAAGAFISTDQATLGFDSPTWKAFTLATVAPGDAAFAAVRLSILGTASGEIHYVDDVNLSGPAFSASGIQAGEAAVAVKNIATDGNNIWAALGISGVHRTVGGATTSTANVPAAPAGGNISLVGYANGRFLAAGSATSTTAVNTLWEVVNVLSAPTLSPTTAPYLFTHHDASYRIGFIAPGRNVIYFGGNVGAVLNLNFNLYLGGQAEIYKTTINPTDTSLTAPSFATYLPDGEAIHAFIFYAGGVVMGTSKGIRTAIVDGAGNLDYGPLIETPGPVFALEPQGRYVWFSYLHLDAVIPGYSTVHTAGLARLDLGYFTAPLVPAWAPDLESSISGGPPHVVTSIASYTYQSVADVPTRRYFAIPGQGVWTEDAVHATYPTWKHGASSTAYVDSGAIRYSTTERKTTRSLDVRHHALKGTVGAHLKVDDAATFTQVGSSGTAGSNGPIAAFNTASAEGESAEVRFTLFRSGNEPTLGPELVRWTLKALPIPRRDETFTLPLIMTSYVDSTGGDGARTPQDVLAEIAYLKGLERAGTIVKLQIGSETHDVFIDAISQQGMHWVDWAGTKVLQGDLTVRCQSVEG